MYPKIPKINSYIIKKEKLGNENVLYYNEYVKDDEETKLKLMKTIIQSKVEKNGK